MAEPRIVVFLDVHLPSKIIKRALEGGGKEIVVKLIDKAVRKKKNLNNLSDKDLLKYFEGIVKEEHQSASVFLITWDTKFDIEAGHDEHKHNLFIIKIPQFDKRKPTVYKKILIAVKNFILANTPRGFDARTRGFWEIKKPKSKRRAR